MQCLHRMDDFFVIKNGLIYQQIEYIIRVRQMCMI